MLTGEIGLQNSIEGAADVFVGKPVNLDKLLSIIDTQLKNRDTKT